MATPNGAARPNGHEKTPEEIQLEIARTRSAITEDLLALSERFSPQQIRENAREVIHEARVEAKELMHDAKEVAFESLIDMKDRALESVSQRVGAVRERAREASSLTLDYMSRNALLLSVLGAGAGWLIMALRNYRRFDRGAYGARFEPYAERFSTGAEYAERPYETGPRARGTLATRAADEAREHTRQALHTASDTVSHASHAISHATQSISGAQSASRSRSRVRDAGRTVGRTAADHRVAVVALTVAAGLGIGLLLPVGRRPRRALLGAGERVWEGAQAAARDVAARARELPLSERARQLASRARDLV